MTRLDGVVYDAEGYVVAVYDLKTGGDKLRQTRVAEIRAALRELPANRVRDPDHLPIIGLLVDSDGSALTW